jgi:hypothetical protein
VVFVVVVVVVVVVVLLFHLLLLLHFFHAPKSTTKCVANILSYTARAPNPALASNMVISFVAIRTAHLP